MLPLIVRVRPYLNLTGGALPPQLNLPTLSDWAFVVGSERPGFSYPQYAEVLPSETGELGLAEYFYLGGARVRCDPEPDRAQVSRECLRLDRGTDERDQYCHFTVTHA